MMTVPELEVYMSEVLAAVAQNTSPLVVLSYVDCATSQRKTFGGRVESGQEQGSEDIPLGSRSRPYYCQPRPSRGTSAHIKPSPDHDSSSGYVVPRTRGSTVASKTVRVKAIMYS